MCIYNNIYVSFFSLDIRVSAAYICVCVCVCVYVCVCVFTGDPKEFC